MVSGWSLVLVFNVITAAAYLGIVLFIVRGLRRTRQLGNNRLALATALIFLTCAAHHLVHAAHLVTAGGETDMGSMDTMRESMGSGLDIAITASTAIAGAVYLGLRRFYGPLLRSPSMFDDASEARYRQLAANLPHTTVFVMDLDLRFVLVEGAGLVDEGYDPRLMEGRLLKDLITAERWAELEPHYRAAVAGDESEFDSTSERTGRIFRARALPLRDESEHVVGALVLSEDVTEERKARAALESAQAFRDAVLTVSPDVTTITDAVSGEETWASRSLGTLLDDPTTEIEPLAEDVPVLGAANRDATSLPDGDSVTTRYRVRGSDGRTRWMSRRSTPFRRSPSGDVLEVLSVVREVTDVVESERALERAALEDSLTGLPNRMLLLDRISSAIARGERTGALPTVLFCDLDGFKQVNDTGGHAAGDAVLVEVARRLRSVLRSGDSIARVGGDEFVVVVDVPPAEHGSDSGVAERLAERIQSVLAPPIEYLGSQYLVSASIGMVLVHPGGTAQEALRDADSAMYRAKQRGKNRIERFDDVLRADALDRAHIEQTLRDALAPAHGGAAALGVAYQPVHRLSDGLLVSFEALARLRDATGAEIAPDRFIPVAEDAGLIGALGVRILDSALAMLARWRTAHPSAFPVTMSVNVSTRQAQHVDMSRVVGSALARHGLQPNELVLELTESVLVESGSSTLRQLAELHASGVGIAIDDFGTGYASLHYLATLPVSSVKIDRSFTATMTTDPTSDTIVRAIIALARDLELVCVVEGIETLDQLESLPNSVHGQGYLFGRPNEELVDSWSAQRLRTP
ncbi:putative bifunctional diguanylate cyclase/phosphodiesterase [Actinomycetes bacterium M1A6_2h]